MWFRMNISLHVWMVVPRTAFHGGCALGVCGCARLKQHVLAVHCRSKISYWKGTRSSQSSLSLSPVAIILMSSPQRGSGAAHDLSSAAGVRRPTLYSSNINIPT